MPEYSLNNLYGGSIIQYMKLRNLTNVLIWVVVLGGGFVAIKYFVINQFTKIGTEQSIEAFEQLLLLDMVGIIILSVVWWFIINTDGVLIACWRSYFEQNSIICGIVFSVLAVFIPLVLSLIGEFGIKAINGHFYSLNCQFILPSIFIFLMFFAPPVQIQEMISPGRSWVRWVIAASAALAAAYLFKIDFL